MFAITWTLNLIYLGLLTAAAPMILWRRVRHGRYRRGWDAKLWGQVPRRDVRSPDSQRPCAWFHAVSVGEVLQAVRLVEEFLRRHPEYDVVITTSTDAGYDLARDKFSDCLVSFCPLDFSWAVREALQRFRPDLLVLVELELWPNLIRLADDAGVKIAVVNGRLGEKSHRGYSRIRPAVSSLLRRLSWIGVQNDTYRDRFADLGATPERMSVTGSIKFDQIRTDRDQPLTYELREVWRLDADAPVFIAGSTQDPEERFAVAAWRAARQRHPDLQLIIVPRHPERFDAVAAMLSESGLHVRRRSGTPSPAPARPGAPVVHLLDTVGELGACWGLADFAFVGGSLTRRGGQNMIEPSAYGAAVMFGPNTWNFRDTVDQLLACGAATVVTSAEETEATLCRWLADREAARQQGARARQFVLSQQGALERTLAGLEKLCGRDVGVMSPRAA